MSDFDEPSEARPELVVLVVEQLPSHGPPRSWRPPPGPGRRCLGGVPRCGWCRGAQCRCPDRHKYALPREREPTSAPGRPRRRADDGRHRLVGGVPPVLAPPAQRHRRQPRGSVRPGQPVGRLLRRGHHDHGRGGVTPGARVPSTAPSPRTSSSRPPPRPTSTRPTPRRSTGRSNCPAGPVPTTWSARCGPRSGRCGPPTPSPATTGRWPCCPTCGPGWPGGPRSATAGTGPSPSSSGARTTPWRPTGWPTPATTTEFLDRWRTPGEPDSKVWEERFGQEVYVPLASQAWADALKSAGVVAADVDHVAVVGLHARAVAAVRNSLGVRPEALAADRAPTVGNLGAAEPGVALADHAGAGRARARSSPWSSWPTVPTSSSCGPPTPCPASGTPRRARRTGRRGRAGGVGRRRRALHPVPHVAGRAACGSHPADPTPSAPALRPRGGPRRGRAGSRPATAGPAASATFLRPGCACGAAPSTRWTRSDWPTRRGRVATFTIDRLAFSHVATGHRGRGRLRRGRPLPLRDDRRRPGCRGHRHPGGDEPSGGSTRPRASTTTSGRRVRSTRPATSTTKEGTHELERDP